MSHADTLQHLRPNKIPQAILAVGPESIGKKTALYAWLKTVFQRDAENHPDLLILRPEGKLALHNIERVRELLAQAQLPPTISPKRVFVIEEAHRLGTAGSNALLKTLEEPPSHALFILITHRLGAILPTIQSRTTLLRFKAPTHQELTAISNEQAARISLGRPALACEIASGGPALQLFEATRTVLKNWGHFPALQYALTQLIACIQRTAKESSHSSDLFNAHQIEQLTRESQGTRSLEEHRNFLLVFQWILAWIHDLERLEHRQSPIIFADCEPTLRKQLGILSLPHAESLLHTALSKLERSLPLQSTLEGFFLGAISWQNIPHSGSI